MAPHIAALPRLLITFPPYFRALADYMRPLFMLR